LLPFNGRREGARLIAIPGEVGIELDNQPCVRRGSDRFEQFLQPQRLNSWTTHWVASKILKSPLISNSVSNNISHCSIVGWEDWARELDAWEVDGATQSGRYLQIAATRGRYLVAANNPTVIANSGHFQVAANNL
jgi:hypothetical protein